MRRLKGLSLLLVTNYRESYRILTIGLSYQVIAILTDFSYQVIAAVPTKWGRYTKVSCVYAR